MRPYHIGNRWIDLDHVLMIEDMDEVERRNQGWWGVRVRFAFCNDLQWLPIGMTERGASSSYVSKDYLAPIMTEEEAILHYHQFIETWKLGGSA